MKSYSRNFLNGRLDFLNGRLAISAEEDYVAYFLNDLFVLSTPYPTPYKHPDGSETQLVIYNESVLTGGEEGYIIFKEINESDRGNQS